jgi:hypothetical protein
MFDAQNGQTMTSTNQTGKTGGDSDSFAKATGGEASTFAHSEGSGSCGAGCFGNDAAAGAFSTTASTSEALGGFADSSGGNAADNTSIGSININS